METQKSSSAEEFINSLNEVNKAMGIKEIGASSIDNTPAAESVKPIVAYEDFMKSDIRLCQVISVEKVEKKDRLYKLVINTGFDERVVVSAIADIFREDDLLFKVLPFVLNLPVRVIAGIESHGMVILAEDKADKKVFKISNNNSVSDIGAIII